MFKEEYRGSPPEDLNKSTVAGFAKCLNVHSKVLKLFYSHPRATRHLITIM